MIRIKKLPVEYDPAQDEGQFALELFLNEDEPPSSIVLRCILGRWIAVAHWDNYAASQG